MDRRRFLPAYHYADNTNGSLTKSIGKPLRDYKIYGESVQNGTPTPEAPVTIESVGDKTVNLFDEAEFFNRICELETLAGYEPIYEEIDGRVGMKVWGRNLRAIDGVYQNLCNIPFKENTQYTMSFNYYDILSDGYYGAVFYCYYTDSTIDYKAFPIGSVRTPNQWNYWSFTSAAGKTISKISCINQTGSAITYFSDFQIEEGNIATEYEPFGYYKVPIKVSGKNLYDAEAHFNAVCEYETLNGYEPTKGVIDGVECYQYWGRNFNGTNETNPSRVIRCNFKENTPYTVSTDWYDIFYTNPSTGITSRGLSITFVYTDGTTSAFIPNHSVRVENKWMHYTQTSYIGRSLDYIYVSYGTGAAHTYLANFQIEEGKLETDYEPYKDLGTYNIYLAEPLRKVGEYVDYVDYRNGCVVRNTQHVILDSSLNYTLVDMMLKVDCLEEQGTGLQGLCTYSPINTALMPGYMYLGENNNTVVVWVLRPSDLSGIAKDIDTFKAWLDSQTTPLEIVCERPTPLIESITLPTILLDKGTLHISVDTKEVKPSNVVWQYYRRGG